MLSCLVVKCAVCLNLPVCARVYMRAQTLSKTRQEDAHEFLLAVLDAVERDTKKGIVMLGGHKAGGAALLPQQQRPRGLRLGPSPCSCRRWCT